MSKPESHQSRDAERPGAKDDKAKAGGPMVASPSKYYVAGLVVLAVLIIGLIVLAFAS